MRIGLLCMDSHRETVDGHGQLQITEDRLGDRAQTTNTETHTHREQIAIVCRLEQETCGERRKMLGLYREMHADAQVFGERMLCPSRSDVRESHRARSVCWENLQKPLFCRPKAEVHCRTRRCRTTSIVTAAFSHPICAYSPGRWRLIITDQWRKRLCREATESIRTFADRNCEVASRSYRRSNREIHSGSTSLIRGMILNIFPSGSNASGALTQSTPEFSPVPKCLLVQTEQSAHPLRQGIPLHSGMGRRHRHRQQ